MNKILLILLIAISINSAPASEKLLLLHRNQFPVVSGALKGMTVGALAATLISYFPTASSKNSMHNFKKCVGVGVVVGGVLGALWAYFHTPEQYYLSAYKGIKVLETQQILKTLITCDQSEIVVCMKKLLVRTPLSLYAAYSTLNGMYDRFERYKNMLKSIKHPELIPTIVPIPQLLADIEFYQRWIMIGLSAIKDDASFITEWNAYSVTQLAELAQIELLFPMRRY